MKLNTLSTVTQKGAQLSMTLSGDPATVQKDAYWLHNHGIAELPDDYREGQDSTVTLSSNLYRISKYIRADHLAKTAQRGGWRAMRAALQRDKEAFARKVKEGVKHFVRSIRTMTMDDWSTPATIYSVGSQGRTSGWRGGMD